ncbi:10846_t:CDS:1, partial [Funneliformis geosporum]
NLAHFSHLSTFSNLTQSNSLSIFPAVAGLSHLNGKSGMPQPFFSVQIR